MRRVRDALIREREPTKHDQHDSDQDQRTLHGVSSS